MGLGRMNGKSALVTGAAFGIGRATALKFADEGARLIVQDIQADPVRSLAAELSAKGAAVQAVGLRTEFVRQRRLATLVPRQAGIQPEGGAHVGVVRVRRGFLQLQRIHRPPGNVRNLAHARTSCNPLS